jgi:phospholipid/cholesterol/gamma-HCH transport system substrate-binding protein
MTISTASSGRQLRLGLVFLTLLGLLVAAAVAQYRGAFRDTISVNVEADRAGLTMDVSAPVKFRGVVVGDVHSVQTDDGKVTIGLSLDKDKIGLVPHNLTAQLVPPTAFGARYVQLSAPADASGQIKAGQIIAADHVTVEVDEAFTNLTQVLDSARPAEVNNALSGIAGAVNERGEKVGKLIDESDQYLTELNPHLDALAADLSRTDDVAVGYDRAMPDLLRTFSNLTTTSDTLTARQGDLRKLLLDLTSFSDESRSLVRRSETGLHSSLTLLDPVSAVLAKYSPELPCLLLGLQSVNKLAERAVGGTNPGVTTITRIAPNAKPYDYPANLPVVGDRRGPACYGLPYVDAAEAKAPSPVFVSGSNPHAGPQAGPRQALATTLFGAYAGLVNIR